ncbi:hypothetical protein WMY93_018713 [Mugilogobius chulae]|uniref:Uncharacterized protein n=1 Tax=Mugilogobius chulae TaxID=88201 RepID=A0AAW0NWX5_9GOBI
MDTPLGSVGSLWLPMEAKHRGFTKEQLQLEIDVAWQLLKKAFAVDPAIKAYLAEGGSWDPMVPFGGEHPSVTAARGRLKAYKAANRRDAQKILDDANDRADQHESQLLAEKEAYEAGLRDLIGVDSDAELEARTLPLSPVRHVFTDSEDEKYQAAERKQERLRASVSRIDKTLQRDEERSAIHRLRNRPPHPVLQEFRHLGKRLKRPKGSRPAHHRLRLSPRRPLNRLLIQV